jgi:hypothetical protein
VGHKQKRLRTDERQPNPEEPALELKLEGEDEESERRLGKKAPPKGGYDPYDRDPLRRTKDDKAGPAKTDLRKLSEWIRLTREVEEQKQRDEAEAGALKK